MASGLKRRFMTTALSLTMLGGVGAATAAPTFAAMPTPPASCNWGDIWWAIGNQVKPYDITHAAGIIIPPGWTYSNTASLQRTDSITGSVTGTVTGTDEANLIIDKVGVSVSLSLQEIGQSTVSTAVSDTWSYTNKGTTTKTFILFTAPHKVTASWAKYQCNRWSTYDQVEHGTMASWDIEYKGVSDCSASYPSGSAQALAKSRYCV